jgi:hypothetical protein
MVSLPVPILGARRSGIAFKIMPCGQVEPTWRHVSRVLDDSSFAALPT